MGSEPRSGDTGHDTESVVRGMIEDEAAHGRSTSPGSTASADAVESLRRAIRDLKHDVRMLKVGMDKQSQVLEDLVRSVDELGADRRSEGGRPRGRS